MGEIPTLVRTQVYTRDIGDVDPMKEEVATRLDEIVGN